MRGKILLAMSAAVAMLALAQPAQAHEDGYGDRGDGRYSCEQLRNGRTAGGAVIGAILGAVVGSNVAARGVRTEGAVLGGVLGGAAGAAIARDSNRCDRPAEGDGYYDESGYPPDEDLEGGPYGDPRYDDRDCQWREQSFYDDRGRWRREQIQMCRDEDGEWRRAD